MELINMTRYSACHLVTPDGHGREILLTVAKATFSILKKVALLDKQPPVVKTDSYYGRPNATSIREAGELSPVKPFTDIVLRGCAYPKRQGDTQVDVEFQFGELKKTLTVVGNRVWKKRGTDFLPSEPNALERIPLCYELAFGGVDVSSSSRPSGCAANPVGLGFASSRSNHDFSGLHVPNILQPNSRIDSPNAATDVAGFSWIAPHWQPRVSLAGRYDDQWLKNRMPNLPDDFQDSFFNAAPQDQQLKDPIVGGEHVQITNATRDGFVEFQVPRTSLFLSVCIGDDLVEIPMRCDTAIVHTEKAWLSLVWRASLDVHQRVPAISWCCIDQGTTQL